MNAEAQRAQRDAEWAERLCVSALGFSYRPDGSLIPRSEPGALLSVEEAARQAARFAEAPDFDTLCIHADMDGAVERLTAIRETLAFPVRKA